MFIEPKTVVTRIPPAQAGDYGRAIERRARPFALHHHSTPTSKSTLPVSSPRSLAATADHSYRPEIIINCAAMARKEDAEAYPDLAYKASTRSARSGLAIAATSSDATLVHLSTDDLFPGVIAHSINEFDKTLPPHIYGKSKEAGERLVLFANCVLAHHCRTLKLGIYGQRRSDLIARLLKACREGQTCRSTYESIRKPHVGRHIGRVSSSLRLNATNSARSTAADKGRAQPPPNSRSTVCHLAGVWLSTTLVGRQDRRRGLSH